MPGIEPAAFAEVKPISVGPAENGADFAIEARRLFKDGGRLFRDGPPCFSVLSVPVREILKGRIPDAAKP